MKNTDFEQFESFFNDKKFQELLCKVEEDRVKFEKSHFNIFSLVSEQYHRENLHSDILAEFLNPKGGHGQGAIFLNEFIKVINDKAEIQKDIHWRKKQLINLKQQNFKDAKVVREQGRIDILITGVNEAIIFENKINNAGDTIRQLPDYFNLIANRVKDGKEEFENIVIVYMPYIPNKLPEEKGWEDGDKEKIYSRLIMFNAFDANNGDLLEGLIHRWLQLDTISTRNKFILEEYSELLKMIGGQAMSNSKKITE